MKRINHTNSEKHIENEFKVINRLTNHGHLQRAIKRCENLFQLYPEHPRVLQGIGLLQYRTGEWENGEENLRKALIIKPDFVDCRYNLGRMLSNRLRLNEAEEEFRTVLQLAPGHFMTLTALASVLIKKDQLQEALVCCNKALEINPRYVHVFANLGSIMFSTGRTNEAIELYRKGLELSKLDTIHSSLLFAMNAAPSVSQMEIYEESLRWGSQYIATHHKDNHGHLNVPNSYRRIRVGYVSGDFRIHPVGHHLKPVLVAHDKNVVEVYLYNSSPLTDLMTEELSGYADHYRDISLLPDDKADLMIRQDSIDILIDLSGHTAFSRPFLFARKPAPVQATWLGYFNTTGIAEIDYIISDPVTIPPGEDKYFTEKVCRLPTCRFCYAPPLYSPVVAIPPVVKNGYITFGSFNNLYKLTPEVVALWARILHVIPDAKLLLKSKTFKVEEVKEDIRQRFALHGIVAGRLELRANSPHPEMLGEYGDVDIALDTFPYNGGVTTCEALWMGVPVVTLEDGTPISRQSKAFLHAIGYPEWVASTSDEYVEIVKRIASETSLLQQIRAGLRGRMADSPLCNGRQFTRDLEAVYRQMWQSWCSDKGCHNIDNELLRYFSIDELYSAGVASLKDADPERAAHFFGRVLKRRPNHAAASNNLGVALKRMRRYEEAIRAFRRALRNDLSCVDTYVNLGCTCLDLAKFKTARNILSRGLAIAPDNIELLNNLGTVNRHMSRLDESRRFFNKVLEIDHNNVETLGQLALLSGASGNISEALSLLKTAMRIEPGNAAVISALVALLMYKEDSSQDEILKLSLQFGAVLNRDAPDKEPLPALSAIRSHLKIGFVSPDFMYHPVGILLVSLFKEFNRSRLSLYCYNNGVKSDNLTTWFRVTATGWRDIFGLKDDDVSAMIHSDEIDILVDLSGHTSMHRLSLFNKRPAPVQVSWMGYGHTTGLSTMDYIIADRDFIRPQEERWFTEQVVFLPHNRFCFTPPTPYPEVVSLPSEESGYITFGSFNNIAKYSDQVIATWSRILHLVPKSRLILKYKTFNDITIRRQIHDKFRKHGISPRRIELRTASRLYLMMAEFGDVDISLDPFPFTGGMTSLLSLWMGVPVITLTGELPISRQTLSFLKAVGLQDLATESYDDYIDCAVNLAKNPDRLANIRNNLRGMMMSSYLCDAKSYAESVEHLFFEMWRETGKRKSQMSKYDDSISANGMVKKVLNVGGNSKSIAIPSYFDGWQHDLLDIDPRGKPDVLCDARELWKLPSRQYDAIYCSHNLEHYHRHEVATVLNGFRKILKDEGYVLIRVPDIHAVMQRVINEGMDIDGVLYQSSSGPILVSDVIYGWHVEIERSGNDFFAHKSGFTKVSLERMLKEHGFPFVFSKLENLEIVSFAFTQQPGDELLDHLDLK